ncbi:hypothetical protein [Fictibacillus halophilus]
MRIKRWKMVCEAVFFFDESLEVGSGARESNGVVMPIFFILDLIVECFRLMVAHFDLIDATFDLIDALEDQIHHLLIS